MRNLKKKVEAALKTIHQLKKQEWVSLKEIYDEIKLENKDSDKLDITSVKNIIEKGCADSKKFSGVQTYILKENSDDLYKSIDYEKIKFLSTINIGDVFTRKQFLSIYKISGQSGIMKTDKINCLVLTTSESNRVYKDTNVENGKIIYTGEGLYGDQKLDRNNETLYNSNNSNIPLYLYSKDKNKNYTFEGRVKLVGEPYQVIENDKNNKNRLVWKFPLSIIYEEDYNFEEYDNLKEVTDEIKKIEDSISVEEANEELVFKDGPLNIRKYRKTNTHKERKSKPDFIAQEIVKDKNGKINEKRIYEQEIRRLKKEGADEQIKLMKEFFENKKENEGYDVLTFEKNKDGKYIKKYIEVKSTKSSEGTPIDITNDEVEFARQHINDYYLYRIVNSDSKDAYVKKVSAKDLLNNFDFVPTSFKIYSK